jgi:hypothetical protein
VNSFPAAVLARALGGRKVLVRCRAGCHPDAADDTIATETTGEAYVVVGIGYLAEIVGEIVGPTVKLDSTDGTTPILITDPANPGLLVLQVPIR